MGAVDGQRVPLSEAVPDLEGAWGQVVDAGQGNEEDTRVDERAGGGSRGTRTDVEKDRGEGCAWRGERDLDTGVEWKEEQVVGVSE